MVDHVFLFHPHSGSDPLPQAYGKKDKPGLLPTCPGPGFSCAPPRYGDSMKESCYQAIRQNSNRNEQNKAHIHDHSSFSKLVEATCPYSDSTVRQGDRLLMMRKPVCLSGRRRAELRRHLYHANDSRPGIVLLPSYALARSPQPITSYFSWPAASRLRTQRNPVP